MGFFKDLKADFSAAINDLVPGGDNDFIDDEIPDDSQTLNQDIDTEAEFSKLDGLLEKVESKAKGNDDSSIFKPIEEDLPVLSEEPQAYVEEPVVIEETEAPIEDTISIDEEPIMRWEDNSITSVEEAEAIDEEITSTTEEDSIDEEIADNDLADNESTEFNETPVLPDEEPSTIDEAPLVVEDLPILTIDEPVEEASEVSPIEEEPAIEVEEKITTNIEPIDETESISEEETVDVSPIELAPIDDIFKFDEVNNNSYKEENTMDEFTSITPEVTENKTEITEPEISLEISDEISVITEGTKIKGNMETTGSFEIRGHVEGDLKCNGKLTVTGTVLGASSSSEFFADASHVEGEIVSSGTVKIGLGSVIIGNITATSAVVAGAVKGDIDVQGPVVVDSSAVILGNIKSRSVVINNGAVIEGFCSQCYSDVDVEGLFGKNK